jgi:hypothetical protein
LEGQWMKQCWYVQLMNNDLMMIRLNSTESLPLFYMQ